MGMTFHSHACILIRLWFVNMFAHACETSTHIVRIEHSYNACPYFWTAVFLDI